MTISSFLWSEQQLLVNRSMWFSRVDSLRPDYCELIVDLLKETLITVASYCYKYISLVLV